MFFIIIREASVVLTVVGYLATGGQQIRAS